MKVREQVLLKEAIIFNLKEIFRKEIILFGLQVSQIFVFSFSWIFFSNSACTVVISSCNLFIVQHLFTLNFFSSELIIYISYSYSVSSRLLTQSFLFGKILKLAEMVNVHLLHYATTRLLASWQLLILIFGICKIFLYNLENLYLESNLHEISTHVKTLAVAYNNHI